MKTKLLVLALLSFSISACTNDKECEETHIDTSVDEKVSEIDQVDLKALETKRLEIEKMATQLTPISIFTEELRAKIHQKWAKIDFYVKDGSVVRIKTYPHDAISKRTEEFYFDKGKLFLASIEDDGSEKGSESSDDLSKEYYYVNDKVVGESNHTQEKEFNIKNSEGEELLQEALEYLDLYAKR